MKITVQRPTEIEVTHITIDVPTDSEDDVDGMPLMDGNCFKAKINVETGQIEGWPETAGTRRFHAFCRDGGTYTLLAPDGKEVAKLEEQPVPNDIVPGDYGDAVDLEIDHSGRITNWPKRVGCSELFAFFKSDDDS